MNLSQSWSWNWRNLKRSSRSTQLNPLMQKVAALCVGIVHGIAGPGGATSSRVKHLGQVDSFLGCFCVASIFIMGVFAALYGEITRRLGGNTPVMDLRWRLRFRSSWAVFGPSCSLSVFLTTYLGRFAESLSCRQHREILGARGKRILHIYH